MHFTRPRELILAALVGLGVGYALFDLAYGSMPSLPVAAGTTLAVLAVIEAILAGWIRAKIAARELTEPVLASRLVALAKASSLLGAIMVGGWGGALAFLLPRSDRLQHAADDLPAAVVGAVCAAVLIGAALWLEHCCRTPDRPESDRADDQGGS